MHKTFIFKAFGMLTLIALMAIAVAYVNTMIIERQQYQRDVKADIARSSAGEQTIVGPILAVPYVEEYTEYIDEYTPQGVKVVKTEEKRIESVAYFLPEELKLDGGFANEYKKRGIYKALMYQFGGNMQGHFELPKALNIKPKNKDGVIRYQAAFIGLGISDTGGISGRPTFKLNNQAYPFEQGSKIAGLGKGIHVKLGELDTTQKQVLSFALNLKLLGMEKFDMTPIANHNQINLSSSWEHPSFGGSFLPMKKTINTSGFKGEWQISSLSSSNQATLQQALKEGGSHLLSHRLESLSVAFVEPINVYSQSDRATKYGLLFIGLTFVAFYLFEMLKKLRIHPAQYTLVGLSMTLFYLLLISFAEMIGFAYAYCIASAACVLLLGYYLSYVLKSKKLGLAFAGFLSALYAALYGILNSEDSAMMMGSLLVFGLLAATMVVTRKVDWYALNAAK